MQVKKKKASRKTPAVSLHLQAVFAMGLLSQGSPLNWEETKKYADHIRKHGIIQFLNIYNKVKERQKDVLKWGDEVRNERKRGKCCCCLLMPFDLSVMIAIVALFLIVLLSLQERDLTQVNLQLYLDICMDMVCCLCI